MSLSANIYTQAVSQLISYFYPQFYSNKKLSNSVKLHILL